MYICKSKDKSEGVVGRIFLHFDRKEGKYVDNRHPEKIEYVNDLKALTQGAGFFNREFYQYEEAPAHVQQKLLKK